MSALLGATRELNIIDSNQTLAYKFSLVITEKDRTKYNIIQEKYCDFNIFGRTFQFCHFHYKPAPFNPNEKICFIIMFSYTIQLYQIQFFHDYVSFGKFRVLSKKFYNITNIIISKYAFFCLNKFSYRVELSEIVCMRSNVKSMD